MSRQLTELQEYTPTEYSVDVSGRFLSMREEDASEEWDKRDGGSQPEDGFAPLPSYHQGTFGNI